MLEQVSVPAITGPTACGKTELILSLAEELPLEIVVCDSRKVFRGLDTGAAKPSAEMRERVRFHLMDIVEPDESFSVHDFIPLAAKAISEILGRNRLPVLEGGTGLYLSALAHWFNFDRAPAIPELREVLADKWARDGYDAFVTVALAVFPEAREAVDVHNPRRMLRFLEANLATLPPDELPGVLAALELLEAEGAVRRACLEWNERRTRVSAAPEMSGISTAGFVLEVSRDVLWERIRNRTRQMFASGLVAEVKALLDSGIPADSQALQGIGYREVIEFLLGHTSLEEAESQVAIHTRQLAKRQRTWFRHQLTDFATIPFTSQEERERARAGLLRELRRIHQVNLELKQSDAQP